MQNSEKLNIKLENVPEPDAEELTEEQQCQEHYETALRYINIAEHMKQYEDQDRYYHRALTNLRKAKRHIPEVRPMILDVVHKKYYARARGKISMYQEASSIRDHARTPTDYYTAQSIFDRIHAFEQQHIIQEKYVDPKLYAEALECSDSKEQSILCGKLAEEMNAKQRRASLLRSCFILLAVIALLAFSRTIAFRICLGQFCAITHHYGRAASCYKYVYDRTGNPEDLEKFKSYLYQGAVRDSRSRNREDIRNAFRELAHLNYKDSEERLVKMERERIAELPDGEKIRFGEVNWRILAHKGKKALLLKDKTQGGVPFNTGGGSVLWENSTVRTWLNQVYITELFPFPLEQEIIIDSTVPPGDNPIFGTKGGSPTTDKLFFMSTDEFLKYGGDIEILPETQNLWWLRTPGSMPGTMSFVSSNKDVMSYGYDVESDEIKVRPAIWVDTSGE